MTVGACFVPISGKTIDLTELKVTGYDTPLKGSVEIQTLNEYGSTKAQYYYYDLPTIGALGWFDKDDNKVVKGDVAIQPGEGLWCISPSAGIGIQATGVVPMSDVAIALPAKGGLSVVNPSPVSVDLTKISVSGYDAATGVKGKVEVQVLDEIGRTKAQYYYYDLPTAKILGWFDKDDNEVEEGAVVLKPGVGLWAMSQIEGLSLVFPAVDNDSSK